VRLRLAPQPVKIRSDIEVSCFTYEGIDAVKAALKAGEDRSTRDVQIKINLIAPPMYVMTTMTLDKQLGIDKLKEATEAITEVIRSYG
jgi:translation initiation factor 2 subunit 1